MAAVKRRYSPQVLKRLWALSQNECYYPDCPQPLAYPNDAVVVGEIAHIRAVSPSGPRHDPDLPESEVNGFDNLIILCPTHHLMIDAVREREWPSERLVELKRKHEDRRSPDGPALGGDVLDLVVELTLVKIASQPRPRKRPKSREVMPLTIERVHLRSTYWSFDRGNKLITVALGRPMRPDTVWLLFSEASRTGGYRHDRSRDSVESPPLNDEQKQIVVDVMEKLCDARSRLRLVTSLRRATGLGEFWDPLIEFVRG